MDIQYSEKVKGDSENYDWAIKMDSDGGYLGVTQYDENGKIKERVLLCPSQVEALLKFVRANKARTRQGQRASQKRSGK